MRFASMVLAWAITFAPVSVSARAQAVPAGGRHQSRQSADSTPEVSLAPAAKPDPKKAKEAYRQALQAEKVQDWQTAYDDYAQAVSLAPNDREYFLMREVAKSRLVQIKVNTAERDAVNGRIDLALKELREASYLDPLNGVVRERIAELLAAQPGQVREKAISALAGEQRLDHQTGVRNFNYRGDTRGAWEQIAHDFGVDVAFDVQLVPRQIQFQVSGVDFPTAARLLGDASGTFWRPLSAHLFFVSDNTAANRRDYEPSLVRTVLLPASETPDEMTDVFRTVREITGITRSSLDVASRTITLRADPQSIAVASDLVRQLEEPPGEMVLEFEILEVDRNYARQLGIVPPQTSTAFSLNPQEIQQVEAGGSSLVNVINQIFGLPSSVSGLSNAQIGSLLGAGQLGIGSLIPPLVAFGGGDSTFLATMPGATANFSEMLSLVKRGQRVLLRAQDGQSATFFVGDRIPISLSQYSSSLAGTGAGIPGVSSANFPTTNYAVGKSPSAIVAANFHTATTPASTTDDLAVANEADGTISLLQGNGDGTFQAATTAVQLPTGFEPTALAAYDFNGDGNQDLVVTSTNASGKGGNVSILLGNGTGGFTLAGSVPTGNLPVSVAVADFNEGASGVNVAVSNQNDNSISIFQVNTDGTFGASSPLIQLPGGYKPAGLATGSFTNSGHIDLAVADEGNDSVSVFLGNGDGTFQTRTDYATGNGPVFVATGDFNQDGISDLAIANNGAPSDTNTGDTISILLGQPNINDSTVGNGTFAPGSERDFPVGNAPTAIAVGDFNVDGLDDLAVTDQTDNAVSVLLGQGSGLFGPYFELPVDQAPVSIASGDFDSSSGNTDVATANFDSNDATVILNSSSFGGIGSETPSSVFPGVEYLDVGLKIKAIPRIHPDGQVTLQLKFENSSLSSQSYNTIPVVNNESVDQTVRVKEDQTAILAGFMQTQNTNALNGLPGVGELPCVQWLSSNQNAQNQGQELLILVTPRMVRFAPRKDHVIYAGQGPPEGQIGGFTGDGFAPAGQFPSGPELPRQRQPFDVPGSQQPPEIPPTNDSPRRDR
jgi:Bacterial type II and III secretion system protein/FG-GAP-like repeat